MSVECVFPYKRLTVFYPFTDVVDSIFSDKVDSLLARLTFLLINRINPLRRLQTKSAGAFL